MLLAALLTLTMVLAPVGTAIHDLRARAAAVTTAEPALSPVYQHAARAVSTWRTEAVALRPVALAAVAQAAVTEPAFVARCVRLNNYWCIKSARWPGEIGSDAEGHTGFATAADGADAAAGLLRRYYRAYGRRTALAIVRRWAPAECRMLGPVVAGGAGTKVPPLARRGLGGTLRARFLARHLPGGAARRSVRVHYPGLRVQPWSALALRSGRPSRNPAAKPLPPLKPVPDIAARIAGTARARTSEPVVRGADDPAALLDRRIPSPERLAVESAALPSIAAGLPLADLRAPAPLCGSDEVRIANYADAIARSVGLRAGDDLALFSPDGTPLPNLRAVMLAMSAVELGSLHAGGPLVEAAIARLSPIPATADATR